jgi:hypothetical protein
MPTISVKRYLQISPFVLRFVRSYRATHHRPCSFIWYSRALAVLSYSPHITLNDGRYISPLILNEYVWSCWISQIGKKLIDFDEEYAALFSGEIPKSQPHLATLTEEERVLHFANVQRQYASSNILWFFWCFFMREVLYGSQKCGFHYWYWCCVRGRAINDQECPTANIWSSATGWS